MITSGSISFKDTRYDCKNSKYTRFARWLDTKRSEFGVDEIVFEAVASHKGSIAAHVYGGFMATVQTFGDNNGVPYEGVHVGTIKKFATGRGNASKQEVIDCMKSIGFNPKDDNEADALALLYWRMNQAQ